MKIYNELEFLGFFKWLSETHNLKDTDMTPEYLDELPLNDIHRTVCNSVAFRWFREKYGLFVAPNAISYENGPYLWFFEVNSTILSFGIDLGETDDFENYEEAELACLIKLIEIVKNK
jgi:hypothetical protein